MQLSAKELRIQAIRKVGLARAYPDLVNEPKGLEKAAEQDKRELVSRLERSKESYRIALDERGSQLTTLEISEGLTRLENSPGIKKVAFLIGGANGHSPALRDQCDEIWSLSTMTMQHELALVVLLEQLYRAYTVKRGEPYHRV